MKKSDCGVYFKILLNTTSSVSCSHFPWIFKVNDVNCPPIQPDFSRHLQPWSRDLKTAFRKLARQWHPARDPRADRLPIGHGGRGPAPRKVVLEREFYDVFPYFS